MRAGRWTAGRDIGLTGEYVLLPAVAESYPRSMLAPRDHKRENLMIRIDGSPRLEKRILDENFHSILWTRIGR